MTYPNPCITEILETGSWSGQPGFVIGGGPSLKGFDFWRLKDLGKVLGCNFAWTLPVCDLAYFKDFRYVKLEAKTAEWRNTSVLKVMDQNGRNKYCQEIHWTPQISKPYIWGTDLKSGVLRVKKGHNAGIELVNLATILGLSPIYLLGFDLNVPGDSYKNWHERYPAGFKPRVHGDLFNKWTYAWTKVADQIKTPIWNCNPHSALNCFPKITIEEGLDAIARD